MKTQFAVSETNPRTNELRPSMAATTYDHKEATMKTTQRICHPFSLFAGEPRMFAWRSRWAAIVMLVALFTSLALAQDTRYDLTPAGVADPPHPATDNAFVRDWQGNIVALDFQYATQVQNVANGQPGQPFESADIVMQQCFGGGFLDHIANGGPAQHTFSSAARWDQTAWNFDCVLGNCLGFPPPPFLDNFTRAYRDFGLQFPPANMIDLFRGAAYGAGVVVRDPFAPGGAQYNCNPPAPGTKPICEYPQYESPDNPVGPNDFRQLGLIGQPGRMYFILVQWDIPKDDKGIYQDRFAVNILRMYQLLTRPPYNVPAGHIAILFSAMFNPNPYGVIGGGSGFPDPAPLGALTPNATNSRANWLTALSGGFFDNGMYRHQAGDRLYIYNTGHGNHQNVILGEPAPGSNRYAVAIANGFDVGLSANDPAENTSIADIDPEMDSGYSDQIQLTFATPVQKYTQLDVDGEYVGTFGVDIVPCTPSTCNVLPTGAPTNSVVYQISVDPNLLYNTSPDTVTLDFDYASAAITLLNVDLRGGDQELLGLPCGQEVCSPY